MEKEARRLEVMKRRQERELAQLVSYEMARKEMQDRAEAKVGGSVCSRWRKPDGNRRRRLCQSWDGAAMDEWSRHMWLSAHKPVATHAHNTTAAVGP